MPLNPGDPMPRAVSDDEALGNAAAAVTKNLPDIEGYALGWDVIIDLILSVIGGCFNQRRSPEQVARAIRRMGITETFALRRACRAAAEDNGLDFGPLFRACKKAADDASPEQALALVKAVQSQIGAAA
jgi:hypothetical protein